MIGIIYLGNNPKSEENLKYLPEKQVVFKNSFMEVAEECNKHKINNHYVIVFERKELEEDVAAIKYLKQHCQGIYIILITAYLSPEVRKAYHEAGINDTLDSDAPVLAINKKLQFICDREDMFFDFNVKKKNVIQFEIPLWKRLFDIVFSSLAIIVMSPVMIITAIAIKLESPGPAMFKSKRVGTNYKIFDFLKFRSMYTDAEKRLKELSKTENQYAKAKANDNPDESAYSDRMMFDDEAGAGMMISEDEVMLVGDDYMINESDFSKQKEEDINNAFVKIENDPRVTKVGRFIRKYSLDELPQLFNILKGDMSIVGNRPLPLYEAEKLTADDSIDRFMAPAGLTGLWQVEERGKGGKMSAEERKQLDIEYGRKFSLALDLKIIFRTFFSFVQKEDV